MSKKKKNGQDPWYPSDTEKEIIKEAARQQLSDSQIAAKLGKPKQTFSDMTKRFPDIRLLIDTFADFGVGELAKTGFEKAKAGDITMLKYFLNNRNPERWADRQTVDVNHNEQDLFIQDLIEKQKNKSAESTDDTKH